MNTIDTITKKIVITENATDEMRQFLSENFSGANGCVICDSNTHSIAHNYHNYIGYNNIVSLDIHSHHAGESMIEACDEIVKNSQNGNPDYFIACGGGTIHDITRVIAHNYNKPFISFPTAASVDGFVSSVAPITTHSGMKITLASVAPVALFADISVLAEAPRRLTASGFGDIIGKYISLADWRIANLLLGESMDSEIISRMYDAVKSAVCADITDYKNFCVKLLEALVLSGLCMQSIGNSRPASGAEHHIAHFLEMDILEKNEHLHGENVAAGALMCAELYHELANAENIKFTENYAIEESLIKSYYGDLADMIIAENFPPYLNQITSEIFYDNLDEIRKIVKDIPPIQELEHMLSRAGINMPLIVDGSIILRLAPYIRSRFTLLKLCRCLEF